MRVKLPLWMMLFGGTALRPEAELYIAVVLVLRHVIMNLQNKHSDVRKSLVSDQILEFECMGRSSILHTGSCPLRRPIASLRDERLFSNLSLAPLWRHVLGLSLEMAAARGVLNQALCTPGLTWEWKMHCVHDLLWLLGVQAQLLFTRRVGQVLTKGQACQKPTWKTAEKR